MALPSDIATVTDFARRQARIRPDAPAFWFEDRETSFATLDSRASQCAQALLAAGVEPGDRVAAPTAGRVGGLEVRAADVEAEGAGHGSTETSRKR